LTAQKVRQQKTQHVNNKYIFLILGSVDNSPVARGELYDSVGGGLEHLPFFTSDIRIQISDIYIIWSSH